MDFQSDSIWDSLMHISSASVNSTGALPVSKKDGFADFAVESGCGEVSSYVKESADFDLFPEANGSLIFNDGDQDHLAFDIKWMEEKMNFPTDMQNFDDLQSFSFPECFSEVSLEDIKISEDAFSVKEDISFPTESPACEPSSPEQFVPASPSSIIFSPPTSPLLVPNEDQIITVIIPSKDFEYVEPDRDAQELLESMMVETYSNSDNNVLIVPQNTDFVVDDASSSKPCSQSQSTPKRSAKGNTPETTKSESILRKKKPTKQARRLEPSERKKRKMGQNKKAATKYREKKRVEFDYLKNEENNLESENAELSSKVKQMESEITYLKRLLREALVAKGLLKNTP